MFGEITSDFLVATFQVLTGVAVMMVVGYVLGFLFLAAAVPRECGQFSSVSRLVAKSYSVRELSILKSELLTVRTIKSEVGSWFLFVMGSGTLLPLADVSILGFLLVAVSAGMGAFLLATVWAEKLKENTLDCPEDHRQKLKMPNKTQHHKSDRAGGSEA